MSSARRQLASSLNSTGRREWLLNKTGLVKKTKTFFLLQNEAFLVNRKLVFLVVLNIPMKNYSKTSRLIPISSYRALPLQYVTLPSNSIQKFSYIYLQKVVG